MNLLEFADRFKDEAACKLYLKELREKEGITCKKCNEKTKHYWLKSTEKWQCAKCKSRTNLKAGTVLYKSRIPVRTWLLCIHLMTTSKTPFSALEMQRQLGMKHHKATWWMMHRVRHMMRKRENRYKLKGDIEMDDAFFEVVTMPEISGVTGKKVKTVLKRGRGSQRQNKVLVAVESTPVYTQTNKHKKKRVMGFVKMIVLDQLNSKGINYEVQKHIDPSAHVLTDGCKGYSKLNQVVAKHTSMTIPGNQAMNILPWVHTVIANAKRKFLGVYHSMHKEYGQNYLSEFTYKLNRRNFKRDMFDGLLTASLDGCWSD